MELRISTIFSEYLQVIATSLTDLMSSGHRSACSSTGLPEETRRVPTRLSKRYPRLGPLLLWEKVGPELLREATQTGIRTA